MEASAIPLPNTFAHVTSIQDYMRSCVDRAVVGLCDMTGAAYRVATFETRCAPLLLLPGFVADPEVDSVGVYLRTVGPIGGHLLMVMPYPMALDLVSRLMGEPFLQLGRLEMSALGEAGNLMGGYFLRELEENTLVSSRPTPPIVLVDMLSTILESVALSDPQLATPKMLTHAAFEIPGASGRADFWVVFDHADPCSCEEE